MITASSDLCRRLAVDADLRVGDCNATGLAADAFDVCLAVGLIEHQQNDAPLLQEVRRILKSGGLLIVTIRNVLCPHVRFRSYYRRHMHLRLVNWKRGLLGEQPVGWDDMNWLNWDSRQHNPNDFVATLRAHGFDVVRKRFAHFYFLPEPLPAFLPRVEAFVGKSMERLSATPLGVLGSSAIISARVTK
jgi:SAM-dependent methyltransferase